ncbi:MAG: CAP domain-containing protein [Candidatus Doudnabacteria bacterium]|nr:CAP domain-containing protein [Candidatus Doudnabacteria bacterium]
MESQKSSRFTPGIFISLALTLLVGFQVVRINSSAPVAEGLDLTLENILNQVNSERVLRNLPALLHDNRLSKAAQSKSNDMQSRHYFSHTDPEGNYIWNKIVAEGYTPYSTLGENLAIDFFNTESLVSAWMNSPTHRQNILNESFKDQGMGLTMGQANTNNYYSAITNTFGTLLLNKPVANKPASSPAPAIPTKTSTKTTPTKQSGQNTKIATSKPTAAPLNVRNASITEEKILIVESSTTSPYLPQDSFSDTAVKPQKISWYEKNRWLNLSWATALFIFLLLDIKLLQKNNWLNLDKKINNLVLLILAIILTAFLYWS